MDKKPSENCVLSRANDA